MLLYGLRYFTQILYLSKVSFYIISLFEEKKSELLLQGVGLVVDKLNLHKSEMTRSTL